MPVSVFSSAALSNAVTDLGHNQQTRRVRNQFPNSTDGVIMSETLEYGYDSRYPRVLHYRKPGEASGVVKAAVGQLKAIRFPMLRESTPFNEKDARVLDPSLAAFQGRNNTNANSNLIQMVLKQQQYLKNLIEMTHTLACYQALSGGVVTFNYPDAPDETLDLGFGSAGTNVDSVIRTALSGASLGTAVWTHANARPMENIRLLASCIRATSEYPGQLDVLYGRAAWDAFSGHSTVSDKLDNRRIESGSIKQRENVEYVGSMDGFDFYVIDTQYVLGSTWTQAWDTNSIAVVPREPTGWFETVYGAPYEIPAPGANPEFLPTPFFSKTFVEQDPPVMKILVESRPIPLIKNPLCMRKQVVIA